jgi:hypothetical protein
MLSMDAVKIVRASNLKKETNLRSRSRYLFAWEAHSDAGRPKIETNKRSGQGCSLKSQWRWAKGKWKEWSSGGG